MCSGRVGSSCSTSDIRRVNLVMPVFCLLTLGRHGNFTAGVTSEQPDLLCTALALNIELLSIVQIYTWAGPLCS
jgi:hypothetical protein